MLAGAIDPMQGSLLILPGSGLVVLGTHLRQNTPSLLKFRWLMFVLIAFGVAALWSLSAAGGFGGTSGRSMAWGLLNLPYLVGWTLSIWGPGTPRWVHWGGVVIGAWYLVIAVLTLAHPMPTEAMSSTPGVVIGLLGVVTLGACIYRLTRQPVSA